MKPFRTPGDGAKAAKAHLAAVLPGLVAAPAPTVALTFPTSWTTGSAPAIGVFDDGGPQVWPVVTKPRIRVTVWADGRDRARSIAGVCMGVLLSHRIDGLAAVTDPTAILEDRDPSTGALTASFTVSATVRTVAL